MICEYAKSSSARNEYYNTLTISSPFTEAIYYYTFVTTLINHSYTQTRAARSRDPSLPFSSSLVRGTHRAAPPAQVVATHSDGCRQ